MSRAPLLRLALVAAAVLAVAQVTRAFVIEPRDAAHVCAAAGAPWWCLPRAALVALFPWSAFGAASLACGVVGVLAKRPAFGIAALLLGLLGLTFYDPETAGIGTVLGLIAVTRQPASRRPTGEPEAPA